MKPRQRALKFLGDLKFKARLPLLSVNDFLRTRESNANRCLKSLAPAAKGGHPACHIHGSPRPAGDAVLVQDGVDALHGFHIMDPEVAVAHGPHEMKPLRKRELVLEEAGNGLVVVILIYYRGTVASPGRIGRIADIDSAEGRIV